MTTEQAMRVERDSMGELQVPADAYYGAQTMRAALNFPISSLRFPRSFIRGLGQVKLAAAQVNQELELLDPEIAEVIVAAATRRWLTGRWTTTSSWTYSRRVRVPPPT